MSNNKSLSPRDIWGKIIIYLREKHCVALHIACGDITDVSFSDDKFIIKTTEEYLFDLLENEENKNELKKAFNLLGIKQFDVIKKEKVKTKAQQDLMVLKNMFKDILEVEGE